MPIRNLKYKTLGKLIRDNLSQVEDINTLNLINKLKLAKKRGWLLKEELIEGALTFKYFIVRKISVHFIYHNNDELHENKIKDESTNKI